MENLWAIFLTGLTVGGLTCLAVQGGLLASIIAAKEEEEIEKGINRKSTIFPTLAFLFSKLFAYTILGFILGGFGGVLNISPTIQIVMQLFAGLYMLLIAFNLLNLHPIFRYAVIQPPRFLFRVVRHKSKSKDLFAPAILGALTVFIPCGTTLAMEALAISSANAFWGAAIMATFVLGTSPLFFGVGWLTAVLGDNFREKFLKIAAFAVIYLGITSINGSLVALNSPITLQSIAENSPIQINLSGESNMSSRNLSTNQNPTIEITSGGYSPSYIKVKEDMPVILTIKSINAYSCALAFRIPELGISKNLASNDTQQITFTPTKKGKLQFNCSMGMYRGIIEVI